MQQLYDLHIFSSNSKAMNTGSDVHFCNNNIDDNYEGHKCIKEVCQGQWHITACTTIISEVRQDRVLVTKFAIKIMVLAQATFLVSKGNKIVARDFTCFAAIDVKPDKLPLETEPVARDNNKI